MTDTFLIYGAYGYTGQLIAKAAQKQGLKPILSGRDEHKLKPLADALQLPYQAVSLDDRQALEALLAQVDVVLHCAGPFSQTSQPMVEACLSMQTHYLDITGEISVFEACAGYDQQAKAAQIMILPGVGFDVVPTDCMALFLKQQLPDASQLKLAFASDGGLSQGTAKTAIEGLGQGGAVRRNGKIVVVPEAFDVQSINFAGSTLKAVSIPWGDVSTAWYSTGIDNITVYMAQPDNAIRMMKLSRYLRGLLKRKAVQAFLTKQVEKQPPGPSDQALANKGAVVWGWVENPQGQQVSATIALANGYQLTVDSAMYIVQAVLKGQFKPGFQTPALCYGSQLLKEITGCEFVVETED